MKHVKKSALPISVIELDARSKSHTFSQFGFFLLSSLISGLLYSHFSSQIIISTKLNYTIYVCLVSLCAVLSFLVPLERVIRNMTQVPIAQQKQLQTYVNWSGLDSINPLLALLKIILQKNRESPLLDQVVINLKILLLQIKTDSKLYLTREDKDFLKAIVDGETHGLNFKSAAGNTKLSQISTILTPSAIHAVGIVCEEEGIDTLLKRYNKTKSTRVKKLIAETIHRISPEKELEQEKSGNHDKKMEPTVDTITDSRRRYNQHSKHSRSGWKRERFPIIIFWIITILYLMHYENIFDALATVFIFLPILLIPEVIHRYRLNKIEKLTGLYLSDDDPASFRNLLNPSLTINNSSSLLKRLLLNEVLENSFDDCIEAISPQQTGILNSLLFPGTTLLDSLPFINLQLEEIIRLDIVIKAIAKYGNRSSLRALRKYINQTTNKPYKIIAEQSFSILEQRLSQKNQQLLRPSDLSDGELLHSAEMQVPREYLHISDNSNLSVVPSNEISV